MKAITWQEAGRFVAIVTALLFADVILRAIVLGYDRAELGGGDIAFAIGVTVVLMTQTRLGRVPPR